MCNTKSKRKPPTKLVASYIFPVKPMGAPRQTQRDKWKKRPVVGRYHEFKDMVRMYAKAQGFKWNKKQWLSFYFEVPMPKSWPKYKKAEMEGMEHDEKPDIDNMLKAMLDTLLKEDKSVAKLYMVTSEWSRNPLITMELWEDM